MTRHAQWVQDKSGLSQVFGALVEDGDGYSIEPTGNPDAFFVDDGDGVSVDPDAMTGRKIATVNGTAQVV